MGTGSGKQYAAHSVWSDGKIVAMPQSERSVLGGNGPRSFTFLACAMALILSQSGCGAEGGGNSPGPAAPTSQGGGMTREQEDYVRRFLNGTGIYARIYVQDRLLDRTSGTVLQYSPDVGADRILIEYVRNRIRDNVGFSAIQSVPPATEGIPSGPGHEGILRQYPSGVVYISIANERWRHIPGTQISEVVPGVAISGDPASTGVHHAFLTESAPGDVPCRPYCRTAEETFAAVRGRIDLILRNVSR
jgi:hypothetical protein